MVAPLSRQAQTPGRWPEPGRKSAVGRDALHELEPASPDPALDGEEGLIGGDPCLGHLVAADFAQIDVHRAR